MRVGFASDHAGFPLKERLKAWASAAGQGIVDFGTDGTSSVDYPDFAHRAAERQEEWDRLVLVCGSGIGISIAANRHAGIRCALVTSPEHAELARRHNDANAIAFGQRLTDPLQAEYYLKIFLETEFEGGRHAGRVRKIEAGRP
ncbi:MAG: RpiB/LacA/LacB family sugar-phosphate isomerase [Acidobacteria bacterium]|nr:RpiB/LacA/LacB family sugar-phosphate isomerase [Acidobacteriota bacterium]